MNEDDSLEQSLTLGSAAFWAPEFTAWSTWIEHVPFAFWLTDVLRPRTIVELGTFRGMSYLAFCQAVKRLGLRTTCFAVDTWRGDEHSGAYGDEVLEPLAKYNSENYADFSTLIQATFDEAATRFGPDEIDLLHIDGLHTYEAVRHDWETWRPKLTERAVVLFHDTAVRDRGFGVWRLWAELTEDFPHFDFSHGCGLGVLGVGPKAPPVLKSLFEANSNEMKKSRVRNLFSRLGSGVLDGMYHQEFRAASEFKDRQLQVELQQKQQLAQSLADVKTELEGCHSALRELSIEKGRLENELREIAEVAVQLPIELTGAVTSPLETRTRVLLARQQLIDLRRANGYLESRLSAEGVRRAFFEERARAFELSASWRVTRPLRAISSRLPILAASARKIARPIMRVGNALVDAPAENPPVMFELVKLVTDSKLFDDAFYRNQSEEAFGDRVAAAEHYLSQGAMRGLDPSPLFSGSWYLSRNPDVAARGVNPLVHYIQHGEREGRDPHPLFDVSWYVGQDGGTIDRSHALEHFMSGGFGEGRAPHPLFDCRWYCETYTAVSGNPLIDYLTVGARNGRNPHPLFDTDWYLRQDPELEKSGMNPLIHYVLWGGRELRSPFPGFDPVFVNSYSRVADGDTETPLAFYARTVGRRDFKAAFLEADPSAKISKASVSGCTVAVGAVVHANPVAEFVRLAKTVRVCEEDRSLINLRKYVLSNGTGDYSDAAEEHGFEYLHGQENRGFGCAHNLLMRKAFAEGADLYIAANPDGFFHPSCISRLIRASQFYGNTAILEAAQFPEEHPKVFNPMTLETPWASGACMAIPRKIYEATGGFDENFFMYCEDVDLSWTALDLQFSVRHIPFALFYHDLTEREGQSWRARQSLLAARYLGHKWGSLHFAKWAESELRQWGLWEPGEEFPELPSHQTRDPPPSFADFSHRFHFARARWQ